MQSGNLRVVGHRVGGGAARARRRQPPPPHAGRARRSARWSSFGDVAARPAPRAGRAAGARAGLGSPSPAPTGLGLIGALGFPVARRDGAAAHRAHPRDAPARRAVRLPAARPTGSRWAQIACLLVYVAVPLPYNALADGRWDARRALRRRAAAPRDAGPRQPGGAVRARRRRGRARRARALRGGCRVLAHRLRHRAGRHAWLPVAVVLVVLHGASAWRSAA